MITAAGLRAIIDAYPHVPSIAIEGDVMERRTDVPIYTLHRPDGDFTVKGLAWGHGHLFVVTEERGTTGIAYEHEALAEEYDEDDTPSCVPVQTTLEAWL